MILNKEDAYYAAEEFCSFFSDMERIDDYLRKIKLERMSKLPTSLPGMGLEDEMFNSFDIHPDDMNFVCKEVPSDIFNEYLEITTSHAVETSIPGKGVKWIVYETNTGQMVGFIRLGSPMINSKPRNVFLGKPLATLDKSVMKRFNDSVIMGFIIVPVQPFGFNYLGGKLLAAICCSHLTRDVLNKKYNFNLCMFETTSLYGSTKTASQYDGMKPYLRYKGLTDSKFAPLINDEKFRNLERWFTKKNNDVPLIEKDASSRKLKTQTKMISIIKSSLKGDDMQRKFNKALEDAKNLTEQKRTYISDYGYENVKEYLNLETDTLKKKDNFDKYEFDNIITWWKKKAGKRYISLIEQGRLRTKLETWNNNPDDIDIIR